MNYRIAEKKDFPVLAKMRWDFKMEGKDSSELPDKQKEFLVECEKFFHANNETWTHWIAESNNEIISHISINHIRKIPKPNKYFAEFAYITNVYTEANYRSKGIGSKLMDCAKEWAKEKGFEIMIVWPSEKAIDFYTRKGFDTDNDVMELSL